MVNFLKLLKNKVFKETAWTIALIVFMLMVFIIVNKALDVANIDSIDVTTEQIYSLTDESKKLISNVDLNVNIVLLNYDNDDRAAIVAKKYKKINDKIDSTCINYWQDPNGLAQYGITDDTTQVIIVYSALRQKQIYNSELTSYNTLNSQEMDVTEQKLTNSILDVTKSVEQEIYFVKGNGEYGIDKDDEGFVRLAKSIANEAYVVTSINLEKTDIPSTCKLLVFANPTVDFSDNETNKIQNYINNGGNILWMQDPYKQANENYSSEKMKNVKKILANYGIDFSEGVVLEDTEDFVYYDQNYSMPMLTYNDIVKDIYSDGRVVTYLAGRIENVSNEKMKELGVTYEAFMKSSENSYYKKELDETNLAKNEGDETGSFRQGEILTKKIGDKKSVMIAYSSAYSFSGYSTKIQLGESEKTVLPLGLKNNKDLILNSVAFLTGEHDEIRSRKATTGILFDKASDSAIQLVFAVCIGVPVIIVLTGIVVTIVRKKRR
jgi:ABC-2 type transport system permease protein